MTARSEADKIEDHKMGGSSMLVVAMEISSTREAVTGRTV